MKLTDLEQNIIVPIVDETKGGMTYEVQMTLSEFFSKALPDFTPEIVDAAPVMHGQWIFHDDDVMPWVSCSVCGRDIAGWFASYKYCPYCGAKMKDDK